MKNFWPQRSNPKGFSIESLARKYRQKIVSVSSEIGSKEFVNNKKVNLDCKNNREDLLLSQIRSKKDHWANRDFSEYIDVA